MQQPLQPADIHLHYMRKELDQTKATVKDHGNRLAVLEQRKLTDKLDWKMIGVIGLIVLGLTGHITIQEIKTLVLGVL